MNNNSTQILSDYKLQRGLYEDCSVKLESLIIDLLKTKGVSIHQISKRIKQEMSLEGKLLKKEEKYISLSQITDIIGIRIIAYFEDEVDKIAEIIESEFDLDKVNSIDKRELEDDRFGYRSLHYVFSLKENRTNLAEYKRFAGLKAELQIRTILQHSWAEIEHDIGYKNEVGIPKSAKRTFYRVAALLETADQEFVKLKNLLSDYESTVSSSIQASPESVQIDKASLMAYISSSKILLKLDDEFSKFYNTEIGDSVEDTAENTIQRIINANIKSIKELDEILNNNQERLFDAFKSTIGPKGTRVEGLAKAIALYYIDKAALKYD